MCFFCTLTGNRCKHVTTSLVTQFKQIAILLLGIVSLRSREFPCSTPCSQPFLNLLDVQGAKNRHSSPKSWRISLDFFDNLVLFLKSGFSTLKPFRASIYRDAGSLRSPAAVAKLVPLWAQSWWSLRRTKRHLSINSVSSHMSYHTASDCRFTHGMPLLMV